MGSVYGSGYIWDGLEEYEKAKAYMGLTPYAMARQFREAFGQPVGLSLDFENWFAHPDDTLGFELIEEEFGEVQEAWEQEPTDGPEHLLKELADLVYVVYGYAAYRGWDLDVALERVHLSNMSKLGSNGEVLKREDGKVLKSENYKPPYLKDLV